MRRDNLEIKMSVLARISTMVRNSEVIQTCNITYTKFKAITHELKSARLIEHLSVIGYWKPTEKGYLLLRRWGEIQEMLK